MGDAADIRVLHVDDEPDCANLAAEFLERADEVFSVTTAVSAAEGLECLAEGAVDCIVSDYDMPGQDGLVVPRERSRGRSRFLHRSWK